MHLLAWLSIRVALLHVMYVEEFSAKRVKSKSE